jgi:tetratricopeptide (TPR) repeat protein
LGLLELQAGRDMLARPYLTQANQLDPFNIRVRNSLKMIEELSTWDVVESEHFRVRYPPGDMEVMAREMLPELEKMHTIVTEVHQHEPPVKTLIELMPDNQWFAVRITGMPELFTIAAATGPVIAMEAPREGPRAKVGVYDWVRVVRHEYTHTVTLSKTKNRLSHWFTEAAAVALELGPRDYNRSRLLANALRNNELFTLDEINFKFVRPEKPTDRSQAYAQGHWMYQFMVEEFGEEAPLRLQDEYAKGKREREAFEAALGVSPESFFEDFVVWAEADVVTWGMFPEPTLDTLRLEETLIDHELRDNAASALGDFASSVGIALVGGGIQSSYDVKLVDVDADLIAFWSAVYPDHADLLEQQVLLALEDLDGVPDESIVPLLDRYATARPVDPKPHEMLIKIYLESSAPERAIPHLRYLDEREQYSPIYAVELANRLAAIGDFTNALQSATRATTIAPFDADYRELAATIAIQAGRLDEAERHISALVTLEPLRPIHQKRLEAVRNMRENS